jgi:homoserine O-acetyltransferase
MSAWLPSAIAGKAPLATPLRGTFGSLPFTDVPFELIGNRKNGVLAVLGGISAGRHVSANQLDESDGWWQTQCGPERALDTTEHATLGIDFLGAHLERDAKVPRVETRDQARALGVVLDHLGVERLNTIVGCSYGGMVALAFAALYPDRVDRLLVIGAAHEPHPMATAVRSIQRDIVRLAQAYGRPADGLDLARRLAMTTYRTAEEFAERFSVEPRVEDYLAHCGRSYVEQFTAERFLCLSQSIDLHRIDPSSITVPTTLVAIEGDAIAPPWQLRQLAEILGGTAHFIQIRSRYGHDAFLKETAAISDIITQTLATEVPT